jgi:hypothetical protein
MLLST